MLKEDKFGIKKYKTYNFGEKFKIRENVRKNMKKLREHNLLIGCAQQKQLL